MNTQHSAKAESEPLGSQRALRDVVRRAGLHELDGGLLVSETREHYEWNEQPLLSCAAHDVEPVAPRHPVVEQGAVEDVFLEQRKRSLRVLRFGDRSVEPG